MPVNNDVIRANKKYEGQTCAICKKEIVLGEFIHICPNCQSINHEECWNNEGGCNSLSCNSLSRPKPNPQPQQVGFSNQRSSFGNTSLTEKNDSVPSNMVPCRFCKEPIMRGARKCKHCNEYQRDEDRKNNFGDNDDTLSVTDVLAIVCCPGLIGIILGTVYCSRYQVEKGVKVLKFSIIWSIIISIGNAFLQFLPLLLRQ